MTWKLAFAMAFIIPFLAFLYHLKQYCDRVIEMMVQWIPKVRRSEEGGEDDIL